MFKFFRSLELEKMIQERITKSSLLRLIYYSILSMGCFWQIFIIFDLYFTFPTNVFIESKFDSIEKPLPAITLCYDIGNQSLGRKTDEVLHSCLLDNEFQIFISKNGGGIEKNLTHFYMSTCRRYITFNYYCITLNSLLQGN